MTAIVAPPAPIIPPTFPALGSSNFNNEAYAWGTAEPAVAQRIGDLASNTHQNATAAHERSVAADQSANDAGWHADRVALLNSLFLGAAASDPTTGKDGAPLVAGNFYVSTGGHLRAYNGTIWTQSVAALAGVSSLNGLSGALSLTTVADYGLTDVFPIDRAASVINSNTTAVAGRTYFCDTSAASFSLTLPASPMQGDRVGLIDALRSFALQPLTVLRNGQRIEGTEDDLLINGFARGFLEFRGPALGWLFISL
mgnify:CR=1 FL=1